MNCNFDLLVCHLIHRLQLFPNLLFPPIVQENFSHAKLLFVRGAKVPATTFNSGKSKPLLKYLAARSAKFCAFPRSDHKVTIVLWNLETVTILRSSELQTKACTKMLVSFCSLRDGKVRELARNRGEFHKMGCFWNEGCKYQTRVRKLKVTVLPLTTLQEN